MTLINVRVCDRVRRDRKMGQLDCLAGLGKMVGEENNDLLPEVSVLVAYVMLPNLGVNVM